MSAANSNSCIEGIKGKAVTSLSDAGIHSTVVPGSDHAFLDNILDCSDIQAMVSQGGELL